MSKEHLPTSSELVQTMQSKIARLTKQRDELLKALEQVMSWIDNWSPNFTDDHEWPADRDAAIAAIASVEEAK